MTYLLDAPNEILLHIVNHVVHVDLESFALSCKRIYNLSEDAIRNYQEKKIKYDKVICGEVTMNQTGAGFHPTLLLRDFLIDDDLCLYPLTFYVGDCGNHIYSQQIMAEVQTALGDLEDMIRLKIQASPYIIARKKDDFVKMVLSGRTDSTIALLLSLLLSMKVSISAFFLKSSHIQSVLAKISFLTYSNRKRRHPLSKLSHGFFDGTHPSTVLGFAVLPSMRFLHGEQIHGFKWDTEDLDRKSGLRSITLEYSTLDSTTLNNLVTRFSRLEDFKFSFEGRVTTDNGIMYARTHMILDDRRRIMISEKF